MKKRIFLVICSIGMALLQTACEKEPVPEPPVAKKNRTVIEYMVADNNLYRYAEDDLNEMESAWDGRFDGHLVVFLYPVSAASGYAPERDEYDETPRLLLISRDQTSAITSRVLKTYSRDIDPCDAAVMNGVLSDAMALAPADRYAVAFWSHGSGWLPQGAGQPLKSALPLAGDPVWAGSKLEAAASTGEPEGITAYSFGQSNSHGNHEMEIDAMARALPEGTVFDFILFDACHMASVELAWEMKDRTEYLIASAAEILAESFPYAAIMAPMFEPQADVEAIGRAFFDYYNERSGAWRSATVGVVRCGRLPELAASVRALCEAGLPGSGISYAGQQYGRSATGFDRTFYDLEDFVRRTWGMYDPAGVSAFEAALQGAVVYAAATPWLFDQIRVNMHCGLSCYLPRSSTPISLEAYRTRFGWSAASGMGALVP